MPDIDMNILTRILLAFDQHSCLSRDQLSENMSKGDRFVDSDELEKALHQLVVARVLVKDMDRAPRSFYRLTFSGIIAAAAAKREEIRGNRPIDKATILKAKGTARTALLSDSEPGRGYRKQEPIFGRQPMTRAVSAFLGRR